MQSNRTKGRRARAYGALLAAASAAAGCVLPGYTLESTTGSGAGGGGAADTTSGSGAAGAAGATGGGGAAGSTGGTGGTAGAAGMAGGGGTAGAGPCDALQCVQWANTYGVSGVSHLTALATEQDRIVIGGWVAGTIDLDSPAYSTINNSMDGFQAVLDGSGLVTSTFYMAGMNESSDSVVAVAALPDGSRVIVGQFFGALSFDMTHTVMGSGSGNVFVVKLGSAGDVQWSRELSGDGTSDSVTVAGVAVDPVGDVYVAGDYEGSVKFSGIAGNAMSQDGYLLKLNGSTGAYTWIAPFKGTSLDAVTGVAVNKPTGLVTVAGYSDSPAVVLSDSTELTNSGGFDAFAVQFDATGKIQWKKTFGDDKAQRALAVAPAPDSAVVIAGDFDGEITAGGTRSNDFQSAADLFAIKIDKTGVPSWAAHIPDARPNGARLGLSVSAGGEVAVGGNFKGTLTLGGPTTVTSNGTDAFVSRFDSAGKFLSRIIFTAAGVNGIRLVTALAHDSADALIVGGEFFHETDFGKVVAQPKSTSDIFLLKLAP